MGSPEKDIEDSFERLIAHVVDNLDHPAIKTAGGLLISTGSRYHGLVANVKSTSRNQIRVTFSVGSGIWKRPPVVFDPENGFPVEQLKDFSEDAPGEYTARLRAVISEALSLGMSHESVLSTVSEAVITSVIDA